MEKETQLLFISVSHTLELLKGRLDGESDSVVRAVMQSEIEDYRQLQLKLFGKLGDQALAAVKARAVQS
jgi:hypothetical protein